MILKNMLFKTNLKHWRTKKVQAYDCQSVFSTTLCLMEQPSSAPCSGSFAIRRCLSLTCNFNCCGTLYLTSYNRCIDNNKSFIFFGGWRNTPKIMAQLCGGKSRLLLIHQVALSLALFFGRNKGLKKSCPWEIIFLEHVNFILKLCKWW